MVSEAAAGGIVSLAATGIGSFANSLIEGLLTTESGGTNACFEETGACRPNCCKAVAD